MKHIYLLLGSLLPAYAAGQSEMKAIPIEKESRPASVAYQQGGVTLTMDPAVTVSQITGAGSTTALQQQMRLVFSQALTPWLTLAYGAGAGLLTQEFRSMQQLAVNSASLSVLNRPALNWKPREGIEIDTSYQIQQNLTSALATEGSEIAAISGKMKVDPKTTVGLGYSYAQNTNFADVKTEVGSIRLTSEYALAERPVTLQLNPGYETTFGAADSQSIRAFVENAVIWKVDNITTLTFGSGFAGGAYTAQSGYILVQHLISPGTSMAMRAEFLNAENDQPGEGFALSAGPTIALAQALSAGLNVRYKMDENAPVERPKNETTLSLSISGRF